MADELPWVKFSFDHLFKDTDDLDDEQFSLYVRAFGKLYRPKYNGVAASEAAIRALSGCGSDEKWERCRVAVLAFFKQRPDGSWEHSRVARECEERHARVEQQKERGRRGGLATAAAHAAASATQDAAEAAAHASAQILDLRSEIRDQKDLTREISAGARVMGGRVKKFAEAWERLTGQSRMHIPASDFARASALCTDREPYGEREILAFKARCDYTKQRHTSPTPFTVAKFLEHFDKVIAIIAEQDQAAAEPERFAYPTADELRERDRREREARELSMPEPKEIPKINWGDDA